ncbi:MAG: MerR family transcriptional regulator [Ignavibacteriae bacterium]|nr:MerR family transcriptional regulator [Ignavibacteriota bacterium]
MRFSIGELSKITQIPIKTLRFYHEKELLIPSEIDEFTNYRYFSEKDYEKAKSIKILRELDFSIQEIKEILSSCNSESDLVGQLKVKLLEIEKKVNRYNEISRAIENILVNESEIKMKNNNEFEIEEKELETILIAGFRMNGKYSEVGEGFKVLGKNFGSKINGKPLTLYYDNEYKENDADFEACVPIRNGKDIENISVRELKGGTCISLIHKGPYEYLSDSYKKLFSYLNEKNYKTILPSREVYIKGPGMIFKGNPNNYLTEIQILLQ